MAALPLKKRNFDVFLSYAHNDGEFVERLYAWLTAKAGLAVWYDKVEMAGGSFLATGLQQAMESCRGIVLIASAESVARGWVKNEYNCAMDERANDSDFRVVALRIGKADVSGLMKGITWIDASAPTLSAEMAIALIRALYPSDRLPVPSQARDIFISCSWHDRDGGPRHGNDEGDVIGHRGHPGGHPPPFRVSDQPDAVRIDLVPSAQEGHPGECVANVVGDRRLHDVPR
jgi:hypothetical protein